MIIGQDFGGNKNIVLPKLLIIEITNIWKQVKCLPIFPTFYPFPFFILLGEGQSPLSPPAKYTTDLEPFK